MSRISIINSCKRDIVDIYHHAIEAIKPERLLQNALEIKDEKLLVKDPSSGSKGCVEIDLTENNIHVVGGGKSVLSMALGLAKLANHANVSHLFSHGSLSLPVGLKSTYSSNRSSKNLLKSIDVECLFGSENNLPDENSVQASQSILKQVSMACERDRTEKRKPLFLVLISGGGSACLTSPRHIDLYKKQQIIKFLVQKGADIVDLNKVRRFFSDIKGGQLAIRMLQSHPESRVVSLILSDVIGDPIEFIASGPTVMPKTEDHFETMVEVMKKYGYSHLDALISTLDDQSKLRPPESLYKREVLNQVIGNNKIALQAASSRAECLGYDVTYMGDSIQGPSANAVEEICKRARLAMKERSLVLGGGEVIIEKLPGETWGQGGRAQEMALDYIMHEIKQVRDLPNEPEDNVTRGVDVFLAGGTDGQDGPTDVAACLASYAEWSSENPFSIEDALKAKTSHDSYNFWQDRKSDWLIRSGLTGTNVMDIYMCLRINKCLSKM